MVTTAHYETRLAAIFYADVAGYSRLTGRDEVGTHRTLSVCLDAMTTAIKRYGGEVVHFAGDAVLAEFASAVDAVGCAAAVQGDLEKRAEAFEDDARVRFRIGVNLGEVIVDRNDIYGDGVNISARLESLAEPGGVCISDAVRLALGTKLPFEYEFMGEQAVKNIAEPVRAYHVRWQPHVDLPSVSKSHRSRRRRVSWPLAAVAPILLMIAVGLLLWQFYRSEQVPSPGTGTSTAMPLPIPDEPSIAVLPFVNMSDDARQEYFVDGMTEDLITDLAKLSGLFVISRNSTFTYKGKAIKVQQVAEELGVRYVLEGSVRRSGKTVRINAQLIDARSGRHLWADRYDRVLDDVFAVQDEVKQQIVSALAVQLSPAEQARVRRRPTEDLKAYEYYLRGKRAASVLRGVNTSLAYAAFREAIKRDPDFAEAYAALAMTNARDYAGSMDMVGEDWRHPPEETKIQALMLANKAQALEPELVLPYLVLAYLEWSDRHYDEALRHTDDALAVNAGDSQVYQVRAMVLTSAGRHEEALAMIDKALRLDPKPPGYYLYTLGKIRFALRNYAGAIDSLQKADESMVTSWFPDWYLTASYGHLGQIDQAKILLDDLLELATQESDMSGSDMSLTAVRQIGNNYLRDEDIDHYVEGLRKAGLPEYPYDFRPAEHESRRLRGADLGKVLFGRSFTVVRDGLWFMNDTKQLGVTESGQSVWQIRHDVVDTSPLTIEDDQICFRLTNYYRGRRTCFMVFRNDHTLLSGRYADYEYILIGPSLFYFSPLD